MLVDVIGEMRLISLGLMGLGQSIHTAPASTCQPVKVKKELSCVKDLLPSSSLVYCCHSPRLCVLILFLIMFFGAAGSECGGFSFQG